MRLAPQRECLAVADRGEPGELPQEIPPLAVSSGRAWTPSSVTGGRSGRLQKFPSQLFKEQGSRVWPRSRVRRWKELTASSAPCQPVFHPGDRAGLQQLPDSNRIAAGCQLLFWKVRRSGILPRYSSPRYLTTGFPGCQPLLFRAAPPGGRLPPGLLLPGPRDLTTVPRSSSTPFLAGGLRLSGGLSPAGRGPPPPTAGASPQANGSAGFPRGASHRPCSTAGEYASPVVTCLPTRFRFSRCAGRGTLPFGCIPQIGRAHV